MTSVLVVESRSHLTRTGEEVNRNDGCELWIDSVAQRASAKGLKQKAQYIVLRWMTMKDPFVQHETFYESGGLKSRTTMSSGITLLLNVLVMGALTPSNRELILEGIKRIM